GGLKELKITENTTSEEADAAFRQLDRLNRCQLGIGTFSGQTPWERHDGDELLQILNGETHITVMTGNGPVQAMARAGDIFVCPRRKWHRQYSPNGVTVLYATPMPSEVSFADDPCA
ncbi:MAG TPA: cupin domain-containing protein, partial [Blastocatellia bacterium]|nr:cupin domain-containing protein [Blastocatellia bacterium]